MKTIVRICFLITFLLTLSLLAMAEEEETRDLIPSEFLKAQTKATSSKPVPKIRYKKVTPEVFPNGASKENAIGITIWVLRPPTKAETGARLLVHEGAEETEWIPVRVESDTRLSEGSRVRLSIEAARPGYLYVIDREEFADGTLGEPHLIFPTTRLSGGRKNRTKKGRVIEIPSQTDKPPYFTLKPSRGDQVGELLTIVVAPEPLQGVQIGSRPVKLSRDQVSQWESLWGKKVGRLEMVGGSGQVWTQAEKEAGLGARLLTHEEAKPQTVYYIPKAKLSDPTLVTVRLPIGTDKASRDN